MMAQMRSGGVFAGMLKEERSNLDELQG